MGFNSRYAGKIHQQIIKGKSGGADNVSIPAMRVRYITKHDQATNTHRVSIPAMRVRYIREYWVGGYGTANVSIPAMRVRYISKNNGKHYH